jgi:hypothetical protein
MSFLTPAELVVERNNAIIKNRQNLSEKTAELYKKFNDLIRVQINEKLLFSATSTWDNTIATECSLYFSSIVLVCDALTEEDAYTLDKYYKFNNCIFNKDSSFVLEHNLGHFFEQYSGKMLFTFDTIFPVIEMLITTGYQVDVSSNPEKNDWGFVVTWKLT